MTIHLKPEEIEAAIAGLVLDDEARKHLESCVLCRTEAAEFEELIDVRRAEMTAEEPDWLDQSQAILDCLPVETSAGRQRQPRWMQPVLAVAAVVVIAVGISILRPDGPVEPQAGDVAVEEILAEMDELLSNESIPGFELIDPWNDDDAMEFGYIEPTPSESVG